MDADALWAATLARLQTGMGRATFDEHLLNSRAVSLFDGTLTIAVPHATSLPWLENRLRRQIESDLAAVANGHGTLSVSFVVTAEAPKPTTSPATDDGVFAGFDYPEENWSKLPNQFIERIGSLTKAEIAVILYLLRHTWGYREYGEDEGDIGKCISTDEFVNGRRRKDGSRLDRGLQMDSKSIVDGLRRAEADGFISVTEDRSDLGRIKKHYKLRMKTQQEKH